MEWHGDVKFVIMCMKAMNCLRTTFAHYVMWVQNILKKLMNNFF